MSLTLGEDLIAGLTHPPHFVALVLERGKVTGALRAEDLRQ